MERIYLDTCAWCRLLDVLDHERIREEFKAVIGILDAARKGKIAVVKSEVLFYEISKIKGEERPAVEKLIEEIVAETIKTSETTKKLYEGIGIECGLNPVDALHIALAIENNIDVFLTTDSDILNRSDCINLHGLVVKNPTEYEVE